MSSPEQLFSEVQGKIPGFVRSLSFIRRSNVLDIEDLEQEAYIVAWKCAQKHDTEREFWTYARVSIGLHLLRVWGCQGGRFRLSHYRGADKGRALTLLAEGCGLERTATETGLPLRMVQELSHLLYSATSEPESVAGMHLSPESALLAKEWLHKSTHDVSPESFLDWIQGK